MKDPEFYCQDCLGTNTFIREKGSTAYATNKDLSKYKLGDCDWCSRTTLVFHFETFTYPDGKQLILCFNCIREELIDILQGFNLLPKPPELPNCAFMKYDRDMYQKRLKEYEESLNQSSATSHNKGNCKDPTCPCSLFSEEEK